MLWKTWKCANWREKLQDLEKPCCSGLVQDKIPTATPILSMLPSTLEVDVVGVLPWPELEKATPGPGKALPLGLGTR